MVDGPAARLLPLLLLLLLASPSSSEDSGTLANALVFSCPHWNDCSGHGKCLPKDGGSKCTCDEGWGAASDNTVIKTPDW